VKDVRCAGCHEHLDDLDAAAFNDDDDLVHIRSPVPPGEPSDDAIIVGLGATPSERRAAGGGPVRTMPDYGCAICTRPLAGATSSGSIVVDTKTGGTRFTVCTPCFDDDAELIGVF
jgi:hypothetical protein